MISGRGTLVDVISMAGVVATYVFAGLPGLVVIVGTVGLVDFMYKRIHGKWIIEIQPEDYHDHPDNPANVLRRLQRNQERQPNRRSIVEVDGERLE